MLNSDFVQLLIKWAFSNSGVVIRWVVGYLIGWIAAKNLIPSGDLDQIQVSLTSGLTAVIAIGYAFLQYWLNNRHKQGVEVVQTMLGAPKSGVVGNRTIAAAADITGENPHEAIAAVTGNSTH